ncbi:hypothetical protein D5086_022922 [Populus alba]|uniref:Uncharacterized protein n=1 Tax=Populus alba TaxID=43335 RepID=A0ACC4B974_POPAL
MLSSSTQYSAERSKNRFSAIKSESNNPIKVNLKNLSQRVIEMVNSGSKVASGKCKTMEWSKKRNRRGFEFT